MRFYLNEKTGYVSHRKDDKELGRGFKTLDLSTDQKSLMNLFNEKRVFAPKSEAEPLTVGPVEYVGDPIPAPAPKPKLDPDAPLKERVLDAGGHWNYGDDACPMCTRTKGGAKLLADGMDADEIGDRVMGMSRWQIDKVESAVRDRRVELDRDDAPKAPKPQPRARERIRVAPEPNPS